jgi:uncharacterized protein
MTGYESEIQKERSMKDEFMTRHPESPFHVGEAAGFQGLTYYPVDEKFRLSGRLERLDAPKEASLRTNRDGQLTCRYVGDLRFNLDGEELTLRVYHAGEQVGPSVFVPFRDKTCGEGSYDEGRYLILHLTEDDQYTVDFNLAFNPYCAYTDRYECGFPPPENDLPVAITAGEMMWIPGPPPEVVEGPSALDDEDDAPRRARPARAAPVPKSRSAAPKVKPLPPPSAKASKKAAPSKKVSAKGVRKK